jgi:hypothetical protein
VHRGICRGKAIVTGDVRSARDNGIDGRRGRFR